MKRTIVRAVRTAALAAGLGLTLGGCNIITPVAMVATPPPSVEAEYALQDRPTVVFVDDRENVLPRRGMRLVVAEQVGRALADAGVLTQPIPARAAMAAANDERAGDLLAIDEIGRRAGAEQIIYVEMSHFTYSADGARVMPAGAAAVRVIDVERRAKLFPSDPSQPAWSVNVAAPIEFPAEAARSEAGRRGVQQAFAEMLGTRVAQLFYKHLAEEAAGSRASVR